MPSKGYLDDITAIPYVVNNSDVTFYVNPITRSGRSSYDIDGYGIRHDNRRSSKYY